MEDKELLEIENLKVNFYTYQGIVKALNGIDLILNKAETFGLVGETGCGKSVTAYSILRLLQTPPGRIESGSIYFLEPPEVRAERKRLLAKYIDLSKKELDKGESGLKFDEPYSLAKHSMKLLSSRTKANPKDPLQSKVRKDAMSFHYDLLSRSDYYMRQVRGKFISMIFQEPTSALNPVFKIGDQISEVTLLHKKKEFAKRVLKEINEELKSLHGGHEPKTEVGADGRLACTACGKSVSKYDNWCMACGTALEKRRLPALRRLSLRIYRNIYSDMYYNREGRIWEYLRKIPLIRRFVSDLFEGPNRRIFSFYRRVPFLRRYYKLIYREALKDSAKMLQLTRIPDPIQILDRYPHELSGGMQQRVMISIALACNPKLLIADEPTTALDVTIQAQILGLMKDLKQKLGTTILLITHNLGVVAETCDRVGVMYAGTMVEIASTKTIFKSPLHPYTQGLIHAVPSAAVDQKRLYMIEGTVPNLIKPPTGCRFHPRCPKAQGVCEKLEPRTIEIEPGHLVSCHIFDKGVGYDG